MMQTMNSAPARNTAMAAGKPTKVPMPKGPSKPAPAKPMTPKKPMPSYPGYPKASNTGGNTGGILPGHV